MSLTPQPEADGSYLLHYAQTWQDEPSPTFNPGTVHLRRQGDILEVEARLTDWDIHDDPDAKFNDLAYERSDVFELFIRAEGDQHYHEIHATPSNVTLQLRFKVGVPLNVDDAYIWGDRLVESATERVEGGWVVRYRVPLEKMTEQRPFPENWFIGCGRYDHQPGQPGPVLSNTAPLTARNFHLHQDWPLYRFAV